MRGAAKDRPPRAPQRLYQLPTDRQQYPGFANNLSLAVSRFASPTGESCRVYGEPQTH